MKSFINAAVLGAAIVSAVPHSHHHAARHAAPVEKRAVQFISTADATALSAAGVLVGKNIPSSEGGLITVGNTGGPFVVQFNNKYEQDIIVAVWGGSAQAGAVGSSFIGASQAYVTHTLQHNTSTYVSFNPGAGDSISGAWGAIYPGKAALGFSGQLDNTIGEYTFTTASQFSTTDVSRMINMGGNAMEIHNFGSASDALSGTVQPVCSATMTQNAFVCTDGSNSCMVGKIVGCVAGTPGTVCNESGMDGGCAGIPATGGYVVVNFM